MNNEWTSLKKFLLNIILYITISFILVTSFFAHCQYSADKVSPLLGSIVRNSIKNCMSFEKILETIIKADESKIENKKRFFMLPGLPIIFSFDSNKAENSDSRLSNIPNNKLEAADREEYAKDQEISNIFVDYLRPGRCQHNQDAEAIASSRIINDTVRMPKEIGIDCKSVRGDREIEPQHYIETKTKIDRAKKARELLAK